MLRKTSVSLLETAVEERPYVKPYFKLSGRRRSFEIYLPRSE